MKGSNLPSREPYPVKIAGTGSYAPKTVISSANLAARLNSSSEWIHNTLGVYERRQVAPAETTSDLAAEAARRALSQAGLTTDDVDLLIVATTTPDRLAPSTATIVQQKLGGTRHYPAFDLAAACAGFLYGLAVASQFLSTGMCECVLLIGSDTLTRITDWNDRDCVYFGDGAGAAVLVRARPDYGLLAIELGADGTGSELYTVPAGGAESPATHDTVRLGAHFARHDGRNILSFAVDVVPPTVRRVLDQAGVTVSDIDAVIPHQASMHTVRTLANCLGVPLSKITTILKNYGNTGAASLPMALDDCNRKNGLKSGDLVLFMGLGAGMTWGAALLRWDA
jgi:3-oxoacyl-[acyl-carrier-protein] synthase III